MYRVVIILTNHFLAIESLCIIMHTLMHGYWTVVHDHSWVIMLLNRRLLARFEPLSGRIGTKSSSIIRSPQELDLRDYICALK